MPRTTLTVEQSLTVLEDTPRRIVAITVDVPAAALRAGPGKDEWSANDVLAHLRACADVWGGHILAMLAEDMPTRTTVSPPTWIESTNYPGLAFQPSLLAFTRQRDELIAVLRTLPPGGWARAATMVGAGSPYQPTVLQFAQRMARHERPHVKQIARAVQAQRS